METTCDVQGRLPMRLTGRVIEGKKMGRRLGFPTANIAYPDQGCSMPCGVYLASLKRASGQMLPGILNHGRHPTLPEGPPAVEIHLLDFDGDLYGETVQINYLAFVRPEEKFPSAEEMRFQVLRDIDEARAYFAINKPAIEE